MNKITRSKENGFTLVELLTVIVIIGILAAIAIPLYTSQKARAQDTKTVSDVRNIVTATESYLSTTGAKFSELSKATIEFTPSQNVVWNISGSDTTNGYCIIAANSAGKKYNTATTALTYDSTAGGLGKSGSSCNPVPNIDITNVGSDTVNIPVAVGTRVGKWYNSPNQPSISEPPLPSGSTGFIKISTYSSVIYALTDDSKVLSWYNNPNTPSVITPTLPAGSTKLIDLDMSNGTYFALTDDNKVLTWYSNPTTPSVQIPTIPTSSTSLTNLAVDNGTVYVTTNDNKVLRWSGSASNASIISPTMPTGVSRVTDIDVSSSTIYLLTDDNRIVSWYNTPLSPRVITPTLPSGANTLQSISIFSGSIYTITDDGRTLNWYNSPTAPVVTKPANLGDFIDITIDNGNIYVLSK